MLNEALPQIRKVNSTCIPSAIQRLKEAVIDAKTHSKHILAFVTGIPGSGKTFLGLQFAHSIKDEKKSINSVYLSGNGPLIKVIKDSLKNDAFIKNLHNITYEFNFSGAKDFSSNVILFDEAQRAWDRNKNSQKKRINLSEPEIMIRLAETRLSWCVMLILVGEGQEIHSGEGGGISLWCEALRTHHKNWEILCPEKLYPLLQKNTDHAVFSYKEFNLDTSLRSHIASDVSTYINHIIDGNLDIARSYADSIKKEGFSMLITRNIDVARSYCANRYKDQASKRYGLISSSKASILKQYKIDNSYSAKSRINISEWYNTGITNKNSCCNMRDVITEFDCQGLELDFPIICWEDDMLWDGQQWKTSSKYSHHNSELAHRYRMNSYRVLLTRGRDGFIIFIPNDKRLDSVYDAFIKAGVEKLGR